MHAYILGGMAVLVARLRPLASALANGAQYASKQLLVFIRKTVVVCIVLAIVTWQATEPYIRRFDRLLEAMLRRNATTASMLAFGEDSLKAAKDVYHKVDTYARKVLQLS